MAKEVGKEIGEESLETLKLEEIRNIAIKYASKKEFVAYFLTLYAKSTSIHRDEIVKKLGCDPHGYYELALCKMPPIVEGIFPKSRVWEIASTTGCNETSLYDILKEAMEFENKNKQ